MEHILEVILPERYTKDQRENVMYALARININTPRQLLEMPTTEFQACKQHEHLRGQVYLSLLHLRGQMKTHMKQQAMKNICQWLKSI